MTVPPLLLLPLSTATACWTVAKGAALVPAAASDPFVAT
jgi:hypothetical protein